MVTEWNDESYRRCDNWLRIFSVMGYIYKDTNAKKPENIEAFLKDAKMVASFILDK